MGKQVYIVGEKTNKPKAGAPKFAVANQSLKLEEFYQWAKPLVNEKGYINIEIKENDKGEYYSVLSPYFHKDKLDQAIALQEARKSAVVEENNFQKTVSEAFGDIGSDKFNKDF